MSDAALLIASMVSSVAALAFAGRAWILSRVPAQTACRVTVNEPTVIDLSILEDDKYRVFIGTKALYFSTFTYKLYQRFMQDFAQLIVALKVRGLAVEVLSGGDYHKAAYKLAADYGAAKLVRAFIKRWALRSRDNVQHVTWRDIKLVLDPVKMLELLYAMRQANVDSVKKKAAFLEAKINGLPISDTSQTGSWKDMAGQANKSLQPNFPNYSSYFDEAESPVTTLGTTGAKVD